jgi:hypothetical protein
MKKWQLAAVVPVLAIGAWWGTSHDNGRTSQVLGGLRVVTAHAQNALSSTAVTAQQAKEVVFQQLSVMQPTVNWNAYLDTARVDQIPNLTQVYDAFTGRLMYRRTSPIDAWVVQINKNVALTKGMVHYSSISGLGVVSANTSDPACLSHTTNPMCAHPGELLAAQADVKP